MSEPITEVKVGQQVPDFEITVYEPKNNGFGKRSLANLKKEGKWTILFFYPADFTFV
jgi:peroxiredoxin (alkyl hydroperoxide reductase subunit C)